MENEIGELHAIIELDLNKSEVLKQIISNVETSIETEIIFCAISKYQKITSFENIGKDIPKLTDNRLNFIVKIISGMINKIKELEND